MADPLDDRLWLTRAVELSRACRPLPTAFCVGAIVVAGDGSELARGYSREVDPHEHAEEAALAKIAPGDPRLAGATIYSSLEPCTERRSRPRTCTDLILATPISRVVIAWREPSTLVSRCDGVEQLEAGGRTVLEFPDLAARVAALNAHLA
jgi:diaminohydroxyphosphoribosylaminopyrimidine deaminase / 5-amino-6-(5-phosphoribosylamino)uracil reductase